MPKVTLSDQDQQTASQCQQEFTKLRKSGISISGKDIDGMPDEATQAAQAYWMVGFNWQQIQEFLEEQGYSPNEIGTAIKNTKEYAKQVLNNGPFAIFTSGQKIKLTSGEIVGFVHNNGADALVQDGPDQYRISAEVVDFESSKQLTKAFALRLAASKLLRLGQKEYELPEGLPQPETEGEGEIPEKFRVLTPKHEKTPPGWAEITPEVGEVEALHSQLAKMVNNIEGLRAMKEELQAELKQIKQQLEPVADQIRQLSKDEQAELKNLFLVASEMENGLDELDGVIFGEYEGKLIGLMNRITEQTKPVGPIEELQALIDILVKNHPRVAKGVLAALDEWKTANSPLQRTIEHILAKYKFRRVPKKKSMRIKGQVVQKTKELLTKIWDKVKDVTQGLYEKVFPAAEESVAAIEQFESAQAKAGTQQQIEATLSHMLKDKLN
jgi:hypothetical protein